MSQIQRTHLLIIDPQLDFCSPKGSLYVPGADNDMDRVAAMIDRLGSRIDDVTITVDSHHAISIFHPPFWQNTKGEQPAPFTLISVSDVQSGQWVPRVASLYKHALEYVRELERKKNHVLVIWPLHCLIGSKNHAVYDSVFNAITKWEIDNIAVANYVTKGSSIMTENYSALQAEVPMPDDVSTQLNSKLVQALETDCDCLVVAGQAKNFCVKSTVMDIIRNFADPKVAQKIVLLTDGMSDVPGFEAASKQFDIDAKAAGVQFSTTVDFLK